jgi:beta-glucosidase
MVPFENDWKRFIPNLMAMVEQGDIPMSRIDDAVRRILRVKLRAGLFHTPPSKRLFAAREDVLGAPAHREKAREAVRKSLVLLKNKDQLLPLHPDTRILVAGKSAHNLPHQAGGWSVSWQGTLITNDDFPGGTSILDGIRQAATAVTYDEAGDSANPKEHDVAIVVIGETPYAEYSGDIQGGQTLEHAITHPEDLAVLDSIHQKGIPVVTVFLSGRPLYTHREINRSHAFIAAWLPGTEGGGLSDVLFADRDGAVVFDFSGTLPFFWPASPCQASLRELGPENAPLFPVGYGLRYSTPDPMADLLDEPLWTEYGCTGRQPDEATDRKPLILLGQGANPHWAPWFGDPSDWNGAPGIPDASIPNVRVTAEDDPAGRQWAARHIHFSNECYWALVGEPSDYIAYFMEGYEVVFDVRVNAPVTHPLFLEITCVYPCIDRVDITENLKQLPVGRWSNIRLPLQQFRKTDFGNVSAPFSLSARGPVDITVANIRWEQSPP